MFNNEDDEWIPDMAGAEPSPLTSMATDPRTALGRIFKGCKCPSHQEIYENWPTHNAELKIAQYMKICVYCGGDFVNTSELRKHLKRVKYARRNISIFQEPRGK